MRVDKSVLKTTTSLALGAMASIGLLLMALGIAQTEARQLSIRPLEARQVYRLLHESGRSDAVPQGRIITQGLAAVGGFALGLTKGIGGSILFDLLTANITGLHGIGGGSNNNGGNGESAGTTQEICFNSRNARSLEEAEAVAEAYTEGTNLRRHSASGRKRDRRRRHKDRRRRKHEGKNYSDRYVRTGTLTDTPTDELVGTQTGTATADTPVTSDQTNQDAGATTQTTEPTAIGTQTDAGTGTNLDNGSGTGTVSESTTQTGTGGAVNCIVIQKPTSR